MIGQPETPVNYITPVKYTTRKYINLEIISIPPILSYIIQCTGCPEKMLHHKIVIKVCTQMFSNFNSLFWNYVNNFLYCVQTINVNTLVNMESPSPAHDTLWLVEGMVGACVRRVCGGGGGGEG